MESAKLSSSRFVSIFTKKGGNSLNVWNRNEPEIGANLSERGLSRQSLRRG
jgi:hypothetical protein